MRSSRVVLVAAVALVVGFLGGLASGAGSPPLEQNERYLSLQDALQDKNTQFLKLARERANLIGQVRVLEQMVET